MSGGPDAWAGLALVACAVLATVVVLCAARLRSLERGGAGTAAGGDPKAAVRMDAVQRDLEAVARRLEHLAARVDQLVEQSEHTLQRVNVVRYDAMRELGGQLSFSVALLDGRKDGVVLSVLNGRDGARAYAKPVSGGRSTFTLSEEEQRAITQT